MVFERKKVFKAQNRAEYPPHDLRVAEYQSYYAKIRLRKSETGLERSA